MHFLAHLESESQKSETKQLLIVSNEIIHFAVQDSPY